MTYGKLEQTARQLGLLTYTIVFGALLVFLPLTAYRPVPLHSVLGNTLAELTAWNIGFVTLGFLAAVWSLMFSQATMRLATGDLPAAARGDERLSHHRVDGGYYDNDGVASALDWLNEVLVARNARQDDERLRFRRAAIVRLRSSYDPPPGDARAMGAGAALFGPVSAIDKAKPLSWQLSRPRKELFQTGWDGGGLDARLADLTRFLDAPP